MRPAVLALLIGALPVLALAHEAGVSHEATVDGVHLDIGYSSAAPAAGESVIFDFNLPIGEEAVKFTDVWVRIDGEDGSVKLATAVYNAKFGGPRLSYVFPSPGAYTISVRYENEGEAVVKTEWPITVVPSSPRGSGEGIPWYFFGFAGLLAGGALGYVAGKRR